MAEYYAVSGIPHVVVIDREGKVQLIRVGSGDKNAKRHRGEDRGIAGEEAK